MAFFSPTPPESHAMDLFKSAGPLEIRDVTEHLAKYPTHYLSRCRFLASASWVELGPNVQAIQATETEFLIRGSL